MRKAPRTTTRVKTMPIMTTIMAMLMGTMRITTTSMGIMTTIIMHMTTIIVIMIMGTAITSTITVIPMLMTTTSAADGSALMGADAAALYRLMTWLSPAFPVGAFSYSSGIEWAVEAGDIGDAETLRGWLAALLADGPGFCDGVFLAHTHRAVEAGDAAALRDVAELAAAFVPSRERQLETSTQGRAFIETTRAAWTSSELEQALSHCEGTLVYPIAVGLVASAHGIPLQPTLHAFLHAVVSNWISAGSRLIPLGQTDSQRVLAALEPVVAATAERAQRAALDDLGSATFRADLASLRHETQYTRLFRS
jgi:urease accessory protein